MATTPPPESREVPLTLPWKRQKGENANQFGAFSEFLSLGFGRTLEATARKTGRSIDWITRIARECDWAERACAYDQHKLQELEDWWTDKSLAAFEADDATLRALRRKAQAGLVSLDMSGAKPADVARLIDVLMRQSRALYGTPMDVFMGPEDEQSEGEVPGTGMALSEFRTLSRQERAARLEEAKVRLANRMAALSGQDDD